MKKLFILFTCFIFVLTGLTGLTGFTVKTGISQKAASVKAVKLIDDDILVRVFLDGHWWIYVYHDGSLINIYLDEDE